MNRRLLQTILVLVLVATPALADQNFTVDPAHARIGFAVRHMVISNVQGQFRTYSGSFVLDDKNVLTSVNAEIDVASLDTGIEKRDNHLKSPDFFDAANYPKMTFSSTSIKHSGSNYTVTGNLTIKGVTKPLTLTGELFGVVKGFMGETRAGFAATGTINRKDFNMTFHKLLETGSLVVADKVVIKLDVEGVRQ